MVALKTPPLMDIETQNAAHRIAAPIKTRPVPVKRANPTTPVVLSVAVGSWHPTENNSCFPNSYFEGGGSSGRYVGAGVIAFGATKPFAGTQLRGNSD
jgi:hypothetical protein